MKKSPARIAVLLMFTAAAAAVACSAPSSEKVGETEQAICVDPPCNRPPGTGGHRGDAPGHLRDPGTPAVGLEAPFNCSGPVPGAPDGYKYMIDEKTGQCAIWKPDPTACDAGLPDDGGLGRICYGYSIVGYYVCPVNHPNMSCSPYTGTCTCY